MSAFLTYLECLIGDAHNFVSLKTQVCELVQVHECSSFDSLNFIVSQLDRVEFLCKVRELELVTNLFHQLSSCRRTEIGLTSRSTKE